MNEIKRKKLAEFIKKLGQIRGKHTELVSVYIPAGYSIVKVANQIRQEQSTAQNIKSKTVRKNVTSALEKISQYLKLYKTTPKNGLVIFCGNVAEKEGQSDIELFALEPPEPIKTKVYFCGQTFVLDPLKDLLKEKEIYGVIVLDKSEASIGLIKGKKIEVLKNLTSIVPGKTKKGGQCLSEDTLVMKDDGEIIKIKYCHNPMSLKSVNFTDFSITNSRITDKWETNKKTFKIITKAPRFEIEASSDHLFFVEDNGIKEKPVEFLKAGDKLLIPEKINVNGREQELNVESSYNIVKIDLEGRNILRSRRIEKFGYQKKLAKEIGLTQTEISSIEIGKRNINTRHLKKLCGALGINFDNFMRKHCSPAKKIKLPRILNEDLAQIIGYFMGDGSFDENKICFHEKDLDVAKKYQKKIQGLLKVRCTIKLRKNKNYLLLRAYSKELVSFLKNEFPEIKNSTESSIPKKILKSKNKVLASFLRGFFDAEGYVSDRCVALGINNKHLAKELQLSLLRFGVLSSVMEYDNKRNPYNKKHRFTVRIGERESLKIFFREIGFSSFEKTSKLKKLLKEKKDVSRVRQLLIPESRIREIIYKYGLNLQKFPKVNNFFRDERKMSKIVFKKSILAEIKNYKKLYEELKKIMNINLLPVEISEIIPIEERDTVDLSTSNQNFIANGIVVHNSSARFARVREGLLFDFLKQVGEVASHQFNQIEDLRGIIIGGPGPIKERMVNEDFLPTNLKKKILGVVDTSYSGEYGLKETVQRADEIISEASIIKEKKLLDRFFDELAKDSGLAVYGIKEVIDALRAGAIEVLLISEEFDFTKAKLSCECGFKEEKILKKGQKLKCPKCGKDLEIKEEDLLEEVEKMAEQVGTEVELISSDTQKGAQLKELGGIGGILRFRLE